MNRLMRKLIGDLFFFKKLTIVCGMIIAIREV